MNYKEEAKCGGMQGLDGQNRRNVRNTEHWEMQKLW